LAIQTFSADENSAANTANGAGLGLTTSTDSTGQWEKQSGTRSTTGA